METLLTLNNAHVPLVINFLFFSKLRFHCKSTIGCYINKTTASVASNDASHEKHSSDFKLHSEVDKRPKMPSI